MVRILPVSWPACTPPVRPHACPWKPAGRRSRVAVAAPSSQEEEAMRYRELGKSGIQVSQIALGTWAMGDNKYWGAQEEKASHETIFAALDSGVTFIDTAEGY